MRNNYTRIITITVSEISYDKNMQSIFLFYHFSSIKFVKAVLVFRKYIFKREINLAINVHLIIFLLAGL